jgi:hypothetical protein
MITNSYGLSDEEVAILRHTPTCAQGRYCGDSQEMQNLVARGMMEPLGKTAWCPDPYFGLTNYGRKVLKELKASGDLPITRR